MEWLLWAFWELCFMEKDTGNNFCHFWANLMSSVYNFVFSSKKGSLESQNTFCYKMMVFWVFTPCSIMNLFRCFRGVCYLHLQNDWIWVGWMLQHSPEPPENLYIIFFYFLADFGRNFLCSGTGIWQLSQILKRRKEGKKERFIYFCL
jgi:hypothetical protein